MTVSASNFNVPFEALLDRTAYLRTQTAAIFNVKNYGALGNNLANDLAAIEETITACGDYGGGIVDFPPGTYLIGGSISVPPGVSLVGVPGLSYLRINHPTGDLMRLEGSSSNAAGVIYGLALGANQVNTGKLISNPSSSPLKFRIEHCTFDVESGLHTGRAIDIRGISTIDIDQCTIQARAGNALFVDGTAEVRLTRCLVKMPAAYATPLIDIENGRIVARGNNFDVTASVGNAQVFSLISVGPHVLQNNECHGYLGSGKFITLSASGITIVEDGTVFDAVNPYGFYGEVLALGSRLTLANVLATSTSSAAITCSTGYRADHFRKTSGAAPTFTLPDVLVPGQEYDLSWFNATGGSLGFSVANYGLKMTQPTVANNTGVTARFRALDQSVTGVFEWVQVSGWVVVAP